jgi:hypothetical protein
MHFAVDRLPIARTPDIGSIGRRTTIEDDTHNINRVIEQSAELLLESVRYERCTSQSVRGWLPMRKTRTDMTDVIVETQPEVHTSGDTPQRCTLKV